MFRSRAVTNLRSLPVSSLRMSTSARATAEPVASDNVTGDGAPHHLGVSPGCKHERDRQKAMSKSKPHN